MLAPSQKYLDDRIQYLEESNRFTLDALDMAASLGDFQASINKLDEPSLIIEETRSRILRLIPFQAIAFYLIEEADNDFYPASCKPEVYSQSLEQELEALIDDGTFAWTLKERKPVTVSTKNLKKKLILHTMATNSRIRGMFIGLLPKERSIISQISYSLLSIVLLNSSNALESFELYRTIREINASLAKKENYRTLFETAPDGVEVLDARGNIVDCNQSHEHLVGFRRNEMVGKQTTAFFSKSSQTPYIKSSQELQRTGYAEGEIELVHKDRSKIPVWRKEKAIYNESNGLVGSIVYNRDISELKRAEKEKMQLQSQLQRAEKMQAIGTMAGGVAHDLNNVLSGLVSYPELILMDLPQDSKLRKPIQTIHQSGLRAAAIAQDLLTMARRGVVVTNVINVNAAVSEYLLSPEFEQLKEFHPQVKIEVDLKKDLMNIIGSPVHLSKVVMNLVSNAAEAMPDGGHIRIRTENRYVDSPIRGYDHVKEGDYVRLIVSDDGFGIPAKDVDRIFEPFYTKKVMGRSGTGLGMAVVWGTVKDHHGYIDVDSIEGKGTTFTLYFPITRKPLPQDNALISIETYMGSGESILVIDDVKEQREIASGLLAKLGYEVSCASSGEEGLAYLENNRADLLVLDMIMDPGIDGLETYRQILKKHPRQKAIIASGFSETKRVAQAQKLGAGTYVKKPYELEKIGLAVRNELDK